MTKLNADEATPRRLPLRKGALPEGNQWLILDAEDRWFATTSGARSEQSADMIVERVNAHDALVAERDKLRAALTKIHDKATDRFVCECEHDNENCCALVDEYCPMCIAAAALKEGVGEWLSSQIQGR